MATVISSATNNINNAYPSSPLQLPPTTDCSSTDTPPPLTPVSQPSISPPTVGHPHTPVSPYSHQSSSSPKGHALKFFGGAAPYHTGPLMSPSYSPDASSYAHQYSVDAMNAHDSYMARHRNNGATPADGGLYVERTPSPRDHEISTRMSSNIVMHGHHPFLKMESSE